MISKLTLTPMGNLIVKHIEEKLKTIIESVMHQNKRTYALVYVKQNNRIIR